MSRNDPKRVRTNKETPRPRTLQEDLLDNDDDDYLPRKVAPVSPKKKNVVAPKPVIEKPKPKPKPNKTELYIKKKVKNPNHKKAMEDVKSLLIHYSAHGRAHEALKSLTNQDFRKNFLTSFYNYLGTIKK